MNFSKHPDSDQHQNRRRAHHQHHCGFERRHHLAEKRQTGKRLGVLGITLIVLHLLYHVAEFLILPTLFVAWGGHHAAHHSAPAVAADTTDALAETEPNSTKADEADSLPIFSTRLHTNFFETLY